MTLAKAMAKATPYYQFRHHLQSSLTIIICLQYRSQSYDHDLQLQGCKILQHQAWRCKLNPTIFFCCNYNTGVVKFYNSSLHQVLCCKLVICVVKVSYWHNCSIPMKILINTEMTDRLKISKQTIKMCFWTERKKIGQLFLKVQFFYPVRQL